MCKSDYEHQQMVLICMYWLFSLALFNVWVLFFSKGISIIIIEQMEKQCPHRAQNSLCHPIPIHSHRHARTLKACYNFFYCMLWLLKMKRIQRLSVTGIQGRGWKISEPELLGSDCSCAFSSSSCSSIYCTGPVSSATFQIPDPILKRASSR